MGDSRILFGFGVTFGVGISGIVLEFVRCYVKESSVHTVPRKLLHRRT